MYENGSAYTDEITFTHAFQVSCIKREVGRKRFHLPVTTLPGERNPQRHANKETWPCKHVHVWISNPYAAPLVFWGFFFFGGFCFSSYN